MPSYSIWAQFLVVLALANITQGDELPPDITDARSKLPHINIAVELSGPDTPINQESMFTYKFNLEHSLHSGSIAYDIQLNCYLPKFAEFLNITSPITDWEVKSNVIYMKLHQLQPDGKKDIEFSVGISKHHGLTGGLHHMATPCDLFYYNSLVVEIRNRKVNPMIVATHPIIIGDGCLQDLGLRNGSIEGFQLTSTSFIANHSAEEVRSSKNGWCGADNDLKPHLQIDFKRKTRILQVTTRGRFVKQQWTKSFKLQWSDDNIVWQDFMVSGKIKVFQGNNNSDDHSDNYLERSIEAYHIRFVPLTWYERACARFDLYGCTLFEYPESCMKPLGIATGYISDAAFSDNLLESSDTEPWRARLNKTDGDFPFGWRPDSKGGVVDGYLQIDFGSITKIMRIDTQGGKEFMLDSSLGYVQSFAVGVSNDSVNWYNHTDASMKTILYQGPQTDYEATYRCPAHLLVSTVARYLRVYPRSFHVAPVLRMEAYGCLIEDQPTNKPGGSLVGQHLYRRSFIHVNDGLIVCSYKKQDDQSSCFSVDGSLQWKALSADLISVIASEPLTQVLYGINRQLEYCRSINGGDDWQVVSKSHFKKAHLSSTLVYTKEMDDRYIGERPSESTTVSDGNGVQWGGSSTGIHCKKSALSNWTLVATWHCCEI